MSMISGQVKELRNYERIFDGDRLDGNLSIILKEAADTIESLSAKLQAANEELERWHTDHINEKIKNPFAWTSTLICHNCDHKDEYIEEMEAEIEKLKAANIERQSEDCGGWITDRVPTKEECNGREREFAVTVDANGIKTLVMDFVYETVRGKKVSRWKWRDRISPWEVIAWHKLPEPYHEL